MNTDDMIVEVLYIYDIIMHARRKNAEILKKSKL